MPERSQEYLYDDCIRCCVCEGETCYCSIVTSQHLVEPKFKQLEKIYFAKHDSPLAE